jgi:glutaminyl-peptide cyclotransferase
MNERKRVSIFSGLIFIGGVLFVAAWLVNKAHLKPPDNQPMIFDGQRAFQDVQNQVSLGPRIIGSLAHTKTVDYIQEQLRGSGWKVELQELNTGGHPIRNVIAKRGKGSPWIILGAHYDSRFFADQDPDPSKRQLPVPGANDGASGVAVLLEIGRVIPSELDRQVWLVFFDAEDNGDIQDWDWIMGSRAFVEKLQNKPDAAVVVDMIGDASLDIYMEAYSNQALKVDIWKQAAVLGYPQFIPSVKYSMIDDHTPFLQAGIPAVDIIDFTYPYWHTTSDTIDKVSAASLNAVGDTLLTWLMQYEK